ncbi:MAG: magnesium transporter [Elusimicrobiales bacterium]|jgi:magnesium transporter|nr:magnesium transporter [Elusimicrobiales bacterium]
MSKKSAALAVISHYIQSDPARAAGALELLEPREAAVIFKGLAQAEAAKVVENLQPRPAAAIIAEIQPETAAALLYRVPHAHVADIFRHAGEDFVKTILPLLEREFAGKIAENLRYPAESAGRLMSPDFLSFRKDLKVGEVITRLRSMARKHAPATYCYVVGEENRLLGVLNMRDLLLAATDAPIEQVMIKDVFRVHPFADREELVNIFSKKHFLSIPVVDPGGRLLGVVNTRNIIESTEEEATEDLQILFGGSAEERVHSSVSFKVTRRLPWLYVNLLTAFMAGAVVALFEDMIARIAVLAVFLPIIAGQGGNAGTQTLAVVIRGMVMREIDGRSGSRLLATELWVGLVNGALIGGVTAAVAWLWKDNAFLGLIVGLAMIVNMIAAGLAGALIPLTMKRLGYDPAHSSGILLTTVTDVVGFFAFLGFAWVFQSKLI